MKYNKIISFSLPNNCIYDLFHLVSIFSRWEHEEVNWSKRWERIVRSCLYKSNQQLTFTLGKRLIQAQSKYVCSTSITTTASSKKPIPPSTPLVGKCQRQNSIYVYLLLWFTWKITTYSRECEVLLCLVFYLCNTIWECKIIIKGIFGTLNANYDMNDNLQT